MQFGNGNPLGLALVVLSGIWAFDWVYLLWGRDAWPYMGTRLRCLTLAIKRFRARHRRAAGEGK
jgi:hypothetical protein